MRGMLSVRQGVITLIALILLLPAGCGEGRGNKVTDGNIEVYYKNGVTKAEAERLAKYLNTKWGLAHRGTVQLQKKGAGYQFRMVVKEQYQKDQAMLNKLVLDGARISRDVLNGAEVEVHACDKELKTVKVIPHRSDLRYGLVKDNLELYYSADVKKEDAQKLLDHAAKFLKGASQDVSMKLSRRDKVMEFHLVFNKEVLKNPGTELELEGIRKSMEAEVFDGAPTEIHLCDENMKVYKIIKK